MSIGALRPGFANSGGARLMRCRGGHRGFTLVELLVTVSIVGILAAIAYPSYQAQIQKARRVDMEGDLVRLAQFMERIHSESGCYNPGADLNCAVGTADAPAIGTKSAYYTVAFQGTVTAKAFTIRATPVAGSSQVSDGYLEIDQLGRRTRNGQ